MAGILNQLSGRLRYAGGGRALSHLFDSLPEVERLLAQRTRDTGNEWLLFGKNDSDLPELLHSLHTDNSPTSVSADDPALDASLYDYGPYIHRDVTPDYYSAHSHPDQIAAPSLNDLKLLTALEGRGHGDKHTMTIFGTPINQPDVTSSASATKFTRGVPHGWMPYLDQWTNKFVGAARSGVIDPITMREMHDRPNMSPVSGRYALPLMHMRNRGDIYYEMYNDDPAIEDLYNRVYGQLNRANTFDYSHGGLTHG
jgi:hypothetical protein